MSTGQIRIKNPYILITKQKLSSAADLNEIAGSLNGNEVKDLVAFVDDIDPLVLPDIIKTRMVRGFRIAIVKMPVLWKDWWFEDLAIATGAKVADAAAGLPLKAIKLEHLGRVGNIVITKEDTYIDGIKDVSNHIADLNKLVTDDATLRASRLNTKTARYFVGAHSDSALSYRRLKVEDAISAAYQALNGGIVAGGGVALMNCAPNMLDSVGGDILKKALTQPIRQILSNAGLDYDTCGAKLGVGWGVDTRTGESRDMFEAGIVDPANIVLTACKNAISVAASVLTASTVVTFPREEEVQLPPSAYLSR